MPTSVIAAALATAASAGAAWAAGIAITQAMLITTFVSTLVLSGLGRALAPRAKGAGASGGGITTNVRSPTAPRTIVYGQRRVGGTVVYAQSRDLSGGDLWLHLIIAMAGHEVQEIGDIWFNDQPVGALDGLGFVLSAPWASGTEADTTQSGTVPGTPYQITLSHSPVSVASVTVLSGGSYVAATYTRSGSVITFDPSHAGAQYQVQYTYVSVADKSYARIHKALGTPTQTADASLVSESGGQWTTAHRLQGIAYVYARIESSTSVWAGGIPTITAIVKGKKVYDPRSSTTAWSRNPALILADYLCDAKYGLGCDFATEIDATALIAAANICDEAVPLAIGGTEPRYQCDAVFDSSMPPADVIEAVLTTMAGSAVYTGGKWRILAGAYVTPTVTLTEADLRGPMKVQARVSRRENFNAVRGTFIDPNANWQPVDFPALVSTTYATEDGGQTIYKDIALGCTTSGSAAQRIAKIDLLRARQQITVIASCKLSAYAVQAGDTVMLTFAHLGWSAKVFEVVRSDFSVIDNVLGVDLTLREIASNVYDWLTSEEQPIDAAPDTNLPNPLVVAPPVTPTLADTATLGAGGVYRQDLTLYWSASPSPFIGTYEAQIRLIASGDWTGATVDASTLAWTYPAAIAGSTYIGRVRAINTLGVASDWAQASPHMMSAVGAPSSVVLSQKLSIAPDGTVLIILLANWTAASDTSVVGYDVELQASGWTQWAQLGTVSDTTASFGPATAGTVYRMRVRSVSQSGVRGAWVTSADFTVAGDTTPPGACSGLATTSQIQAIQLTWTNPTDADYAWTEVWVASTNDRATATLLAKVTGTQATHGGFGSSATTRYYWVRAVDNSGNAGAWYPSGATSGVAGTSGAAPAGSDTTAPGAPTIGTPTTAVSNNVNGEQSVTWTVSWTAPADLDIAYYEVAFKEGAGGYVTTLVNGLTYTWTVRPFVSYTARVRAVDTSGNLGAYSATATLTSASDTTAPAAPTGLTATAAVRTAFLQWTNPSDSDIDIIEVTRSTTNSRTAGTVIGSVNAAPGSAGMFADSGLNPQTTYYYWLRSRDTSDNPSTSYYPASATAGVSVTTAAVGTSDIAAGTITGDRIQAGTLSAAYIQTATALPGSVTVGVTGVSIGTVQTQADDPITRANAKTTQLSPGLVLISGATTLASWRNGGDNTKIEGGSIAANTISANKLSVGLRGIDIADLRFTPTSASNNLAWTAGTVNYTNDSGTLVSQAVSSGSVTWTTGTVYVYWNQASPTTLQTTTSSATAYGPTKIVVATYTGASNLIVNWGRTLIDGATIITGTIIASSIAAGTMTGQTIQTASSGARMVLNTEIGSNNSIIGYDSSSNEKIRIQGSTGYVWASNAGSTAAINGVNTGTTGPAILGNALSSSGPAIKGSGNTGPGVEGNTNSSGPGLKGSATSGYGAELAGNATRAPLAIGSLGAKPSTAATGDLMVYNDGGGLRLCIAFAGTWYKIDATYTAI